MAILLKRIETRWCTKTRWRRVSNVCFVYSQDVKSPDIPYLFYQTLPKLFNIILPIYVRVLQEDIFHAPGALKKGLGKTPGPELKSRMALRLSSIFLGILSGWQSYNPTCPSALPLNG